MSEGNGCGIDFHINIRCTLAKRTWIVSCSQLGTVRHSPDRHEAMRQIVADIESFLTNAGVAYEVLPSSKVG